MVSNNRYNAKTSKCYWQMCIHMYWQMYVQMYIFTVVLVQTMVKHLTLKSVLLKASDSDEPNRDSVEHVEVTETYYFGPTAKRQKRHKFENMLCKVTFGCFFK